MINYLNILSDFFANQSFVVSYVIPVIVSPIIVSSVFTQLSSSKRNKTENLTQKLEELYLLVEKARLQLFERVEVLKDNPEKRAQDVNINTLHGIDSIDRVAMYTSLYFPLLSKTAQELKQANINLNSLILKYDRGESISNVAQEIITSYISLMDKIQQEIINNKPLLVKKNTLPKLYKR